MTEPDRIDGGITDEQFVEQIMGYLEEHYLGQSRTQCRLLTNKP